MHGLGGCSGLHCTKPCVVSTNNTLTPASQVCSSLCSSGVILEQEPLLLLEVGFLSSSLDKRVHGLIDSGASFNFISQSLVQQLNWECKPCKEIQVHLADGCEVGTSQICSGLVSSGQWCAHVELIVLNLAFSMVLGIPWLKAVGPQIEQSTGAVAF